MAITFDQILLDDAYSALADGGPEFATAIVRAGNGGAISSRNSNREDYVSRYEIDYMELEADRRQALRTFAILRDGQARGFRFLAPDDHALVAELVGKLNSATGEVEYITATDGTIENFYLIQHLSDQCNNYTRRITKPSPFDDFHIYVYNASNVLVSSPTLLAGGGIGAFNTILETNATTDSISGVGLTNFTLYQWTGKLNISGSGALPSGWKVRVSCVYHLPVAFTDDWHKFSVDEVGISSFKVGVEEILPAELGIV